MGVKFSSGRIAHVLDKGALLSFLSSDDKRDWLKALEILRHCTAFRWHVQAELNEEKPVPLVETNSLAKVVEHHASAFGKKLGARAVVLFEDRVRDVFSRGGRESRSDMFRPAIEEHGQNRRSRQFENCVVSGLRDTLLAWCAVDARLAREYVKSLLDSDSQILRRIGIYVLNERWADLSSLYATAVRSEFFEPAHIHELYTLLRQRFESFPQEIKIQTLEAIRELPELESDDADHVRRLAQLRWLDALKETRYEPAVTLFRELQEETKTDDLEHPDFRIYTEVRWGAGSSPYQVAELVAFADAGVIAEKLNDFQPLERRQGPSREGLVAALESAVTAEPETFIRALPQLLNAKTEYRCGTLYALRDLWEKSKRHKGQVSWEQAWLGMFKFFEALTAEPDFWSQVNEWNSDHGQRSIACAIAELLGRGTRDDTHAYPEELLPRGLRLIRELLDNVKPTADAAEKDR